MTLGGPLIPQVQPLNETEDNFFNLESSKNAFAIRGTEYEPSSRFSAAGSLSMTNKAKARLTNKGDLDNINNQIEARANELTQRIKEAAVAKAQDSKKNQLLR